MVEYVILIVIAVSLTSVVYLWLKGFVPSDNDIECKDGVAIYISKAECEKDVSNRYKITLEIKNTGRYQLRGFHIKGTNDSEDKIPSIDLSTYFSGNSNGKAGSEIYFLGALPLGTQNPFGPNNVTEIVFENIDENIKKIEIIPRRVEEINEKERIASCKNAAVTEYIYCS